MLGKIMIKNHTKKDNQRRDLLRIKREFLSLPDSTRNPESFFRFFQLLPEYTEIKKIISFTPLPDEPDISLINDHLYKSDKEVILIPAKASSPIPPNTQNVDTVIVPMQGFDRFGNRIGRGGGWYDRFLSMILAENPKICKLSVCFSFLEMPQIITDDKDVKMDIIITEKEIIRPFDSLFT